MEPAPVHLHAWGDGATPTGVASVLAGIGVSLQDDRGWELALSRPVAPHLPIATLEHLAILTALEVAAELGALRITIHCDSSHVISQVTRCILSPESVDVTCRIYRVLQAFRAVDIVPIDREQNIRAHGLARTATYQAHDDVRWWKRGAR